MSRNFELYRRAAGRIQQGWTKWKPSDGPAKMCLLQAVAVEARAHSWACLPSGIVAELHSQLLLERSFVRSQNHKFWVQQGMKPAQMSANLWHWNDAIGRRKYQVVRLLNRLADRLELEWLQAEANRLNAHAAQVEARTARLQQETLREENELLQRRVSELENEVAGLHEELDREFVRRLDAEIKAQLSAPRSPTWLDLSDLDIPWYVPKS
jgi:cell division protein FtsB